MNTRFLIICIIASLCMPFEAVSQRPKDMSSADIYNALEKLNTVGTVLYIAAHPDDENTRLISYFANERKVRTAYLSLTRGDGGQNLIGTQIWEQLGLIRTNELLQARSVDGGEQFFTRANDFGYSKHPDETLAFWDKDEVMHDVIKVIRSFKPDIIVNRFDHRTPGQTHGHHTSSAMLSVEAFDLAGDANYLRERLPLLDPWQPERVFFNTSWWFYGGRDKFAKADKTNLYGVDAGVYYPTQGISNTEIAARSRSMHKSQGFGSAGTRGAEIEYVELINGSSPSSKEDPLSGIDITWTRLQGGATIGRQIQAVLDDFDFAQPATHISDLVDIYKAIGEIDDDHWRDIKQQEVKDIIQACAGLYLEVRAERNQLVHGDHIELQVEATNRSSHPIHIKQIHVSDGTIMHVDTTLGAFEALHTDMNLSVSQFMSYSNPYWLNDKGSLGMYQVSDPLMINKPISPATYQASFDMEIDGVPISIDRDVIYKYTDPVVGEVYKPVYVVPDVSLGFADPVYILSGRASRKVTVDIKSYRDDLKGSLQIEHPEGWTVTPTSIDVHIKHRGGGQRVTFDLQGPAGASSGEIKPILTSAGQASRSFDKVVTEIEYDHIPDQVIIQPSVAKVEKISLAPAKGRIAYVKGAGDKVASSLRQIGYDISDITVGDISSSTLQDYDVVVIGIRAYNVHRDLFLKKDILMDYMNEGGTVIVQYMTSRRIKGDDIAPYPMELSRDRVTDEHAAVTLEIPDHPLLNYPNKITAQDFEGWVQERGLYFANKWDDRYETPLSCHDKGEPNRLGGMLVAEVGKGHYIYTGYSWFRELPAGVPGAYRLFANMLSIGHAPDSLNNSSSTNSGHE